MPKNNRKRKHRKRKELEDSDLHNRKMLEIRKKIIITLSHDIRVVIHKRQCPVATRLKSSYGNRIIATEWDTHKDLSFLVTIYIKGIDSMGLLNEVTQVISRQLNVNIRKLTIETNDGIFEGKIQLYVHDVDDVRTICNNLKQIQNIKQVTRVEE